MGKEEFMPIGKAARLVGVTTQTIRRWQKAGKIEEVRSPTNRRLYSLREIQRIVGQPFSNRVVLYARVSSAKHKADGNLDRQVQRLQHYAQQQGYEVTRVFQEQASGINEKRKQLAQLLTLAEQRQIHRVLIEYPDRLARFGYRYLVRYLASYGVTIEVTQKTEPQSSQEELVRDLLTIVTVFSARLYGARSHEFRHQTQKIMEAMTGGESGGHGHQNDHIGHP